MSFRPIQRARILGASLTAATLVVGLTTAAYADPVTIPPMRSIGPIGSGGGAVLADDGTLYVNNYGSILVWGPSSDGGAPDLQKTFTGVNTVGQISLHPSAGLAYADDAANTVNVIDPTQADGPAVPVRSIGGASTTLDDPQTAAWASDGSLWVVDVVPTVELLRFAPGADGDVAPVTVIGGSKTGLAEGVGLSQSPMLAALPNHGVVVTRVGFDPTAAVFTGSQSGDVRPARMIRMRRTQPNWLNQGVAADAKGRIYLGAGPLENDYGRLDVFAPNAQGWAEPLISLGGMEQNFQIPAVPALAPNGNLALMDLHVIALPPTLTTLATVQVYRSLFLKPGKVKALKTKAAGKNATISWKAGTNPSRTPLTYAVVIKKGKKVLVSKKSTSTRLAIKRSTLPKGKLTVSVQASNVGGKASAAKKTLKN